MKVLVATYGTEGDARPFAALCRGLLDAGHDACLLADESTLGAARRLGVPAMPLAGDIRQALSPGGAAARGAIAKGGGVRQTSRLLAQIANQSADAWLQTLIAAGRGCDVILAAGLAAFAAFSAAEHLGVRSVGAGMIPITPTSAFPSPFLPAAWIPRALNRASHRLVNGLLWRSMRHSTNQARERVGLGPRRAVWEGLPMIYGISPVLVPPPSDWPADVRMCGQWLVPGRAWTPDPDLERFLAAGDPPIYVGFGSMAGFDEAALLGALFTALNGRRALFHQGWSGVDPALMPDNVLMIGDVPHDWLLPRTAAVIHHGGSGTAHSALRAGRPSVVAPFAGDQAFWAERLRQAGGAAPPVDVRRPTAGAFAAALDFAATETVRRRARDLGETMRAEDGVRVAVDAIERIVAR